MVTDIDVYFADIARHFRMHVHILKWLERTRDGESIFDCAALHKGNSRDDLSGSVGIWIPGLCS
jgi:hypothetical protein